MASEGVCWGRSFSWSLELVQHPQLGTELGPARGRAPCSPWWCLAVPPAAGQSQGRAPRVGGLLSPREHPRVALLLGVPCSSTYLGLALEPHAGVLLWGQAPGVRALGAGHGGP